LGVVPMGVQTLLCGFVVISFCSAALGLGTSAAAARPDRRPSPQAIYKALLTTPVKAEGPFFSAKVIRQEPSTRARRHHIVGAVEVDLNGGAVIVSYLVFPTRSDALGDWRGAHAPKGLQKTLPATQFPQPATIYRGSLTRTSSGKKTTVGYTLLGSVASRVIVTALTITIGHDRRGELSAAIDSERFAFRHLHSIQTRLSGRR
jgi:hypothetical protein